MRDAVYSPVYELRCSRAIADRLWPKAARSSWAAYMAEMLAAAQWSCLLVRPHGSRPFAVALLDGAERDA